MAGKRPDHVLQFSGFDAPVVLAIESKDRLRDFEPRIGPRLVQYLGDLMQIAPNIVRRTREGRWCENEARVHLDATVFSAGAFISSGGKDTVANAVEANELDLAISVSFPRPGRVKVLMVSRSRANAISLALVNACQRLGDRIEVEVHSL